MSYWYPIADCRNVLAITQIMMYLYRDCGTTPLSSPKLMIESKARDMIKIIISCLRGFTSTARLNAEMNPAIGAFI